MIVTNSHGELTPFIASSRLAERYVLRDRVGSGGMALVYLADDLRHDRPVAVKIARPELSDQVDVDRFVREIRVAARLSHPGIVPVFDSGVHEGRPFYVMPFVGGEPLGARLRREGRLSIADALPILSDVAGALDYAHAQGVIHRDLKPDNVLIAAARAQLTDFGVAFVASPGVRLTLAGVGLGTPTYMSPEQFEGESIGPWSDIYSLGCVTFELLSGQPPFSAPTAVGLQFKHCTEKPPQLSEAELERFSPVLQRALSKSPGERFTTAGDFVRALREAMSSRGSVRREVRGPAALAPIGRDREIREIARLVETEPMVTLLGPGGVGKSTLAQAVTEHLKPYFPDGCFTVSADAVKREHGLMAEIARSIGITGPAAASAVVATLRERRCLLLLDGVEEVPGDATLLAELIDSAPLSRVLVTSRRSLGFEQETVFETDGLEMPAAITLFEQRLMRHTRKPLESGEVAIARRICESLEGAPLALHHAAHLRRIMSLDQILEQVTRDPGVLEARLLGIPERHQSLRLIFERSLDLLSEREQRVLCRLAVFVRGFDFAAASAVADADLATLRGLVDTSFVTLTPSSRYQLHSVHRQFALQRLERDGAEIDRVRAAHATYFMTRLASGTASGRGARLAALHEDVGNVVEAWRHLVRCHDGAAISHALNGFSKLLLMTGHYVEAREALLGAERAFPDDAGLRIALVAEQCQLLRLTGPLPRLRERLRELMALGRAFPRDRALITLYNGLGEVALNLGKSRAALRFFHRAVDLARAIGDREAETASLVNPAIAMTLLGRLGQAERQLIRATAAGAALGDDRLHAVALLNLAALLNDMGRFQEAQAIAADAVAIASGTGDVRVHAAALANVCAAALETGDSESAASTAHEAKRLFQSISNMDGLAFVETILAEVALRQGQTIKTCLHLEEAIRAAGADNPGRLGYVLLVFAMLLLDIRREPDAAPILAFVSALNSARPSQRSKAAGLLAQRCSGVPVQGGRSIDAWAKRVLAEAAAIRLAAQDSERHSGGTRDTLGNAC